MSLISAPLGFWMPDTGFGNVPSSIINTALNAATKKLAIIGYVNIDGRGTKTISSAGGAIHFRPTSVTWANGATTLDVGIQDVDTATGPVGRPDGTFDVKATLTGGAGITTNTHNTVSMTTGSKTIAHGDLIAIVYDMTARGGADSLQIVTSAYPITSNLPLGASYDGASWTANNNGCGGSSAIIQFDDGTLGQIGTVPPAYAATTVDSFTTSTNPNERGIHFQTPWDCKIDAIGGFVGITDANSDFTLKLYSDPLGTPALVTSVAVPAEILGVTGNERWVELVLPSEVELTAGTVYGLTVLATGSSNSRLRSYPINNEAHRVFINVVGTTCKKITRNGSSGAFSAESPAVTIPMLSVRISALHSTGGAASGIIAG
jgi:hypothetical protein